ncbi:tail fiber protein [Nocardioides sp.]|uniref:phage tail protein n=1 Tax=Nocardioides sp. TaxID=35761 RepID=UPI0031FE4A49|nr:phage tail protein [Nocardioides sp.]
MTDQFIGEVRMFGGNFAPQGWALCNGQLLPITQNTALFSLLGTFYGGNGQTTFALPNLQARFPVHAGNGPGLTPVELGESGGAATATITGQTMPAHRHPPQAVSGPGSTNSPAGAVWAQAHQGRAGDQIYATAGTTTNMALTALGPTGTGQPHNNMPPFLVVNFIIALQGIYPQRG